MEFVVYHVMYGLNEIPLEQNMESKYLGGALFFLSLFFSPSPDISICFRKSADANKIVFEFKC